MKKRVLVALLATALTVSMMTGCGSKKTEDTSSTKTEETSEDSDQEAADKVAKLIDDIYVQERTDKTDEQCKAAKEAWDKLTDAQKELVEGENADPDYFGRDTGDASKDDPLNEDNIGENEILVVSFGTSFNDSRAEDIGGVEKALQAAYPDWSVRRAFTAQIIINHVQARDDEKIDNMDQALEREFFRLIAAEKEEIHRWYMEQLYQEFGTVRRFKGKNIYFGGFMDEISLIGDG